MTSRAEALKRKRDRRRLWPSASKEHKKQYREKNRERILAAQKEAHLLRKYGLSASELEKMQEGQEGLCAICKQKLELYVDHCHSSGIVRELLCSSCNAGLGNFKDNIYLLVQAAVYIKKHNLRRDALIINIEENLKVFCLEGAR